MTGIQMRLVRAGVVVEVEMGGGGSYPGRLGEQQYAGGGWLVLLSWACRQLGPWVPRFEFSPLCCPGEVRQIHVSSYTEIAMIQGNDSAAISTLSPRQ
ncbi:hypothetical protein CgunFtcFv8_004257 [Champsocephalus gunnari]|uniref:Uncharacterized protein n=1 Tax=Champsocephalus gunnari TaxID=52237 RepID=A0AAN8E3D8_CHAGU|nr:hypothetical protein CgunFtcFv8_004257 [Champsocephalus gunnari]